MADRTLDIALYVFPGFQIQDLSGPLAAFEVANRIVPAAPYRTQVVSLSGGAIRSSAGLEVLTRRIRPARYDTFLVAGGRIPDDPADLPSLTPYLNRALDRGTRRIASVCTGAFILAAAGLLDGRRATTHWKYTQKLQQQFPRIKVEGNRIHTKDGQFWTSAGVTAGIDLTLAMIEDDFGADVSRAIARMMVVYLRRPGGQSQFSAMTELEPDSDRIREVLIYMREHLKERLTTEKLAELACLSPRQFGRTFLAETGETPAKAVERLRIEAARQLVERGTEPIEIIAQAVGFIDPERMRRAFIRVIGHPPQGVRRMANQMPSAC